MLPPLKIQEKAHCTRSRKSEVTQHFEEEKRKDVVSETFDIVDSPRPTVESSPKSFYKPVHQAQPQLSPEVQQPVSEVITQDLEALPESINNVSLEDSLSLFDTGARIEDMVLDYPPSDEDALPSEAFLQAENTEMTKIDPIPKAEEAREENAQMSESQDEDAEDETWVCSSD